MVVSAALAKYVYVTINSIPGQPLEITSSDFQQHFSQITESELPREGELNLVYRILEEFGFRSGVSVFIASEVPPGTGLGSSGSVAVALIKALAVARGRRMSPHDVAELACEIEIDRIGSNVGKQDQFASAYGGVNRIRFRPNSVTVEPLDLDHQGMRDLSNNLMLFFTGSSHSAGTILKEQSSSLEAGEDVVTANLKFIRSQADEAAEIIASKDGGRLGILLHEGWMAKRKLSGSVTNPGIDTFYEDARVAGATGGKITGAGGGGFLLLYVPTEARRVVVQKMASHGLTPMRCDIDGSGATVLMNSGLPLGDRVY